MKGCLAIGLSLFALLLHAKPAFFLKHNAPKPRYVVYITLDGVRWQDAYDKQRLPKFWQRHAANAAQYGGPEGSRPMSVASTPVSLPSYQSQTSGAIQGCEDNACGRIQVPTFLETLIAKGNLSRTDVAVFASWPEIALASEMNPGTLTVNAGNQPMMDPATGQPDTVMAHINSAQRAHPLPEHERMDKYTLAQARHYLYQYNPHMLWISFNDADEAAHAGNKKAYDEAIGFYDNALHHILSDLKKLKRLQETLIIITTDHGRGEGKQWMHHGPKYTASQRTWAFIIHGELQRDAKGHYSTLSIRPTIEQVYLGRTHAQGTA